MKKGRRLAFWLGVAGLSVVANYAVTAAAIQFPGTGVARFAQILHAPQPKGAPSS